MISFMWVVVLFTHLPLEGHCYKSVYCLPPTGEAADQYAKVNSNPTQSVYHNYHTLEPDSANQEDQSQYEVPRPQQHHVYNSNEVREKLSENYETVHNEWL